MKKVNVEKLVKLCKNTEIEGKDILVGQIADFKGLYGLKIDGEWYCVGTWEETENLKEEIIEGLNE